MKLQGRNLSLQMSGEDVKLLHQELQQLGYKIDQAEVSENYFGQSTDKIIKTFQESENIKVTGIVDKETAKLINLRVDAQKPQKYIVKGQISDTNNKPLTGAVVRAYDQDTNSNDFLGKAVTNSKGFYEITYTTEQFNQSGEEKGSADLFIQVVNQQDQVLATSSVKNDAQAVETINLVVKDEKPQPPEEVFIVRGTIRQENDTPAVGLIVRAFDRDLRAEQLLGEQTINTKGYYEIAYTQDQFRRAEKGSADLVVRLFDANGEAVSAIALTTNTDTPLETITYNDSQGNAVSIPIWFNAPPVATINGTVIDIQRQTLSLYERIWLDISPLVENIPPADLGVPDIAFLSPEAALEKAILARFILAHRLAQQAIQPEFWFVVLGGSVYEYREERSLEEQLEEVLAALPSLDAIVVGKALTRGFNLQEISKDFQDNTADWIEAFLQFIARQTVSDSEQPTFVKLVLEDADIRSPEKQIAFARLFNQYRAITPELLDTLEQDDTFTTTEIADLRTSFQLSNLTQGDFSVVKTIKQEFSVRQPEQIRTLAKRSESEWVNLVATKYATGEIQLPIEVNTSATEIQLPEAEIYGKMLDRQFREAFPTTAFTGGLERALQNGGSQGLRRARDMSRFLNHHESFELLNTSLDEFLQECIDPELRELVEDENFKLEVKAVQRVSSHFFGDIVGLPKH